MKTQPCPLEPLDGKLIAIRREAPEKSRGGILLPDVARQKKSQQGRVVAVGPGKRLEDGTPLEMPVKVGQWVVFGQFAGTEIEHAGEKYVALHVDDLLAVIVE